MLRTRVCLSGESCALALVKKIIAKTVQVYTEENDGHRLKSHNFSERIDTTVFDQLQAKEIDDTKNF